MRHALTLVLAGALATSIAQPAYAQMSEGERKAAARAAYGEGIELQEKGKPTDALARFEAAQKLFDAPTHLLHIAQCQVVTGKLVEASETYETLIRKPLPPGSPDAFVQAQEQGKNELNALKPRVPTLRITLKPEPQALQNLQITQNDRQIPAELVGIARPVNPGPYRLNAVATGWATPAPIHVEVAEREAKTVEVTLQQGAPSSIVAAPPPPAGTTPAAPAAAPPPYDAKTGPEEGPSATGVLVGARAGIFVPGSNVDKNTKFENFATAGPGLGFDLIGRFAKMILVGGTLEVASLGAPEAKNFAQGQKAEVSTSSVYLGVLAGIMPNVDKVTFVADAGAGFRVLSRSLTISDAATSAVTQPKTDTSYSGFELALAAGLSIPAGPIRFVPKAGVAFGQFSNKSCELSGGGPAAATLTGCTANATISEASHTMLSVLLGVYYSADLSKKGR